MHLICLAVVFLSCSWQTSVEVTKNDTWAKINESAWDWCQFREENKSSTLTAQDNMNASPNESSSWSITLGLEMQRRKCIATGAMTETNTTRRDQKHCHTERLQHNDYSHIERIGDDDRIATYLKQCGAWAFSWMSNQTAHMHVVGPNGQIILVAMRVLAGHGRRLPGRGA